MSVPTTFLCPHCGAQYPVKPVLVGKVVRCTTCKNPFRLRPDGVADKVEVGTTSVPKPAAPAPAAPAPAPAPARSAPAPAPAAATIPTPVPAPAAASPLRPPTDAANPSATRRLAAAKGQLTAQQLEARKAMADSLSAAAGEALKGSEASDESSRVGTPGAKKTSDPKRTSSFLKPKSDPKKAGKGPAILTGEGEREAANSRKWQLGFVAVLLLFGVVVFIATRSGARTAAIQAFIAEVPQADNRFGRRMEAIQARGWSPTVTAFLELPSPVIGSEHVIPAASLSEALGKLAGLSYVAAADRWISPDKVEWLTRQVAEDPKGLLQRLERTGVVSVDNKVVTEALRNANLSDEELSIVHDLLLITGPLAGRLARGPAPAIRWCTVHGRGGTWLFNPGGGYKTRLSDYTGLLVAFTGEGWPNDWRFLTLAPVQKPDPSLEK